MLSLTRNTCSVAARRPHFHKPNARRGPFGILTDEAVQVSELNPVRLGYMARAMRNTTCRDDASACFRSHSNRCGVLVCMPSLQDLSRGRLKIATCLARFADVGCGHGLATSGLAFTHGFNMVGVDILDEAVSWASARVRGSEVARQDNDESAEGSVTFVKGSAYSLPFSNRSLDGIVALNVLEHLDDLPTFIQEAQRVLKTGGIFAFHTINRSWSHAQLHPFHRALTSSALLRSSQTRFFGVRTDLSSLLHHLPTRCFTVPAGLLTSTPT